MHAGMWGLAVIVIVVASWLMYRYNWKEWTRHDRVYRSVARGGGLAQDP